jgi:hypothetical protein
VKKFALRLVVIELPQLILSVDTGLNSELVARSHPGGMRRSPIFVGGFLRVDAERQGRPESLAGIQF